MLSPRGRVLQALREIQDAFEIDPLILQNENVESLINDWAAYLAIPKENCKEYDKLKRRCGYVFSDAVFVWLRDYTNYFVRNAVMAKRKYSDKVVDKMAELV